MNMFWTGMKTQLNHLQRPLNLISGIVSNLSLTIPFISELATQSMRILMSTDTLMPCTQPGDCYMCVFKLRFLFNSYPQISHLKTVFYKLLC